MVPIAALSACHERPPPTLISVLVTEIQQPCVGTARDVTPALTPTFVEKPLAPRTRRYWIPVTSTGMREVVLASVASKVSLAVWSEGAPPTLISVLVTEIQQPCVGAA